MITRSVNLKAGLLFIMTKTKLNPNTSCRYDDNCKYKTHAPLINYLNASNKSASKCEPKNQRSDGHQFLFYF